MSRVTAIVLSAGKGRRMNSAIAKQYLLLDGIPVLAHSLRAFDNSNVDDIVIVCGKGDEDFVRQEIVEKYGIQKVTAIVEGGSERYFSVYNGLMACEGAEYVLIHDGARPYVSTQLINECMNEVSKYPAVVVAVRVTDTIKVCDENGYVTATPNRECLWSVQTPQCFDYSLIFEAYTSFINEYQKDNGIQKVTDDASVVELYSKVNVKVINGDYKNIKITNPGDIK